MATSRIVALVATVPRRDLLLRRSIPSIARQTRQPEMLILVGDNEAPDKALEREVRNCLPGITVITARNQGVPGVASTWNTGIRLIESHYHDCYVAILDDDDEWDDDHLETCSQAAQKAGSTDLVISGLRARRGDAELPRSLPVALRPEDFLIGNPGWQGSNTFIRLKTLQRAGNFTEGLASCNDRDLAVRVLSLEGLTIAFTGKFTATWHLGTTPDQLSRFQGEAKKSGLAGFLRLHGHRMSDEARRAFFDRAEALFGISEKDIESPYVH